MFIKDDKKLNLLIRSYWKTYEKHELGYKENEVPKNHKRAYVALIRQEVVKS